MIGMETRARAGLGVDSKIVDATGTHHNGKHLLSSTQESDDDDEEDPRDLELEAMKKDIKSEVAEEGQDEVWSEARTIPIKKMSPLKTDFETPQMGLSTRSTARPASVESAVLGLTMETKDIDCTGWRCAWRRRSRGTRS